MPSNCCTPMLACIPLVQLSHRPHGTEKCMDPQEGMVNLINNLLSVERISVHIVGVFSFSSNGLCS